MYDLYTYKLFQSTEKKFSQFFLQGQEQNAVGDDMYKNTSADSFMFVSLNIQN